MDTPKKITKVAEPSIGDDAYKQYLTASMNERYHGKLEARYSSIDLTIRVMSAVVGTSALGAMFLASGTLGTLVWKWLTALVAATSAAVAAVPVTARWKRHAGFRADWISLKYRFHALHRRVGKRGKQTDEDNDELDKLMEAMEKISTREPGSPNKRLLEASQNEVLRSEGLSLPRVKDGEDE